MAIYEDLEPIAEFGEEHSRQLRAVGWLEAASVFPTGRVENRFIERLKELLEAPFQPAVSPGVHECELCQFGGPLGTRNLFVPGDGVLYVMPELALHYMGAHHYLPPEEFRDAVLACPDMGTMDYRRKFLANGGRGLVQDDR